MEEVTEFDESDICLRCGQPCFNTGFTNSCEAAPWDDDEIEEGAYYPEEYGLEETK